MIIYIIAVIAGFVLLVKGADAFVDGAAGIAKRFGIPEIIIGLTIVAMGTSAPEAAVSLTAAFKGAAEITIGNIVGSNILNVLIILGLASAIVPIAVQKDTIKIDIPFMIFISVLLTLLGMDGHVSMLDGAILFIFFAVYMGYLFISAKKSKEEVEEEEKEVRLGMQLLLSVGGVTAIILGSKFTVYGATGVAQMLHVSDRIIGLTVVALGTSLPELFTSVTAARKGNADIAIGNIVGSNIFNILFVVGLTAIITPVPYAAKFMADSVVMILAGIVLLVFVLKKKELGRVGGICMLIGYAGYFVYLLMA